MVSRAKRQRLNNKPSRLKVPLAVWPLLALCALAIVGYWNSFDVPFVFDDIVTIQKNEGVRFGDYFRNPTLLGGRGLLYMTFAVNYLLDGMRVWGYHLVNLVLHILNGVAVFFISTHVFRKVSDDQDRARLFGFFAAAVFLLHPVQTQSVTYVSSRSELLSTLFYSVAFLIFVKVPRERVGFLLSLLVILPFLLGLLSKETAITLPGALVLYDFFFLSDARIRPVISRWRFYIAFVIGGVTAIYYLLTRVLVGSIGAQEGHLRPWEYLLTQFRVVVQYIRILFLPVGLNLDHHVRPSGSLLEFSVIVSLFFLLSLAGLGWYYRRKEPVLSFCIFWFFLTLSPTSSFVPILDVMFEHRLYLPLTAVSMVFPFLLDKATHWLRANWDYNLSLKYCGIALVGVFTVMTIMRNQVWRDEATLWADVITKSPHKARGYNGLGLAYYKTAQYQKALDAARIGMENVPEARDGFYETIGNMNLRLGRFEEAVSAFLESAKTDSSRKRSNAYNNVGVGYLFMWQELKNKQPQLAEDYFRSERDRILSAAEKAFIKSLEAESDTFNALDSYINVMHDNGKDDQIAPALESRFGKDNFRVFYGMAKVADWKSELEKASGYYEKASQLHPNEKMIYFNHAYTLTSMKQTDAAINKYIQALRMDPLFVEANFNVALLYSGRRDFSHALEHLQEILRMNPTHLLTHVEMAKIFIQEGNKAQAREHLSIVLSSSPGHKEATELWQKVSS